MCIITKQLEDLEAAHPVGVDDMTDLDKLELVRQTGRTFADLEMEQFLSGDTKTDASIKDTAKVYSADWLAYSLCL